MSVRWTLRTRAGPSRSETGGSRRPTDEVLQKLSAEQTAVCKRKNYSSSTANAVPLLPQEKALDSRLKTFKSHLTTSFESSLSTSFESSLSFRSLNEMCFHFKKVTHASPLQHLAPENAIEPVKPDGVAADPAPVCAAAAAALFVVLVVYVTEPVRGPPQNSVDYHGHGYRSRDDGLQ